MGFFRTVFGDGGPYMKDCPICGLMAGSKPGGFTDFYGLSMFGGDSVAYRNAVSEYQQLSSRNPYDFVCWPAVVTRWVSMSSVQEYRQIWENNHPGDRGSVWKDITVILDGKTRHNPVV